MATIPMVAVQADSSSCVKHRRQLAEERRQRRQDRQIAKEGCTEKELCGFMPLLQDFDFSNEPPHIQAIIGRSVNIATTLSRHCGRFDQQWVHNVQQSCLAILLDYHHKGKWITNKNLRPKVLEAANADWTLFDSPRVRNPVCGKSNRIKRQQHELKDQESYGWADVEYDDPTEQMVAEGHTVKEACEQTNTSRSSYYRERGGDPRYKKRLPEWNEVGGIIVHREYKPPTFSYKHVPPEDMPSARSKLYAECHCQCDADKRLIDRFLARDTFTKAEKRRLRELAYNKHLL